ncbi:MAG: B12-binding domain-containing radical SAM protein, partial [bacterium]
KSGASIVEHTGRQDLEFSRIGLVGAAVSDHPAIERLCMEFVKQGKEVGISSLRPDNMTQNLVSTLVQGGLKSVTMAPESGSERMREVIGKPIQRDEILQSAELCDQVGLRSLKLYFMVGLPFETDSDAEAIVELSREIARQFRRRISLSLSTFVPKANTPFQWEPLVASDVVKRRVEAIKRGLSSRRNIKVASRNPREVEMQAIFSRGDARVGAALHNWYVCGNWKRAFKNAGVDRKALLYDKFSTRERLPWDFIDVSFPKSLLRGELSKAKRAAS